MATISGLARSSLLIRRLLYDTGQIHDLEPAGQPRIETLPRRREEIYGERVERVVLFGSRARGDARKDSDYDVAVFLRDMGDRMTEMNCLADLSTDILYDTGEFIHAMPYRAGFLQ